MTDSVWAKNLIDAFEAEWAKAGLQVANHLLRVIVHAVVLGTAEEREACARAAEAERGRLPGYGIPHLDCVYEKACEAVASAIRARGIPPATQNGSEPGGGE